MINTIKAWLIDENYVPKHFLTFKEEELKRTIKKLDSLYDEKNRLDAENRSLRKRLENYKINETIILNFSHLKKFLQQFTEHIDYILLKEIPEFIIEGQRYTVIRLGDISDYKLAEIISMYTNIKTIVIDWKEL